jgi:hypothetical protein
MIQGVNLSTGPGRGPFPLPEDNPPAYEVKREEAGWSPAVGPIQGSGVSHLLTAVGRLEKLNDLVRRFSTCMLEALNAQALPFNKELIMFLAEVQDNW